MKILPLLPLSLCHKLQTFIIQTQPDLILCSTHTQITPFLSLLPSSLQSLPYTLRHISPQEFETLFKEAQRTETLDLLQTQVAQEQNLAIAKLFDFILQESILEFASDIHFESFQEHCQIRLRVDGVLNDFLILKTEIFALLSSSLKLECSLDIHENRKPQDGRLKRIVDSKHYDLRLSSLPTDKGESFVIRILCQDEKSFDFNALGFEVDLQHYLQLPYGLVFITGPTGSGKSTTLYSLLNHLNDNTKKIITIEDPIEYDLAGLTQVAIDEKYGFGFSQALRSILRQDPDIIMVGEIRDLESLSLSIQASLTGHLVFSTLHTNDALSAIERLLDMGAQSYLIASTLSLVIAQRLVRKLCPFCKTPVTPSTPISPQFQRLYEPKGCIECNFKGYQGRTLIYEILPITPKLKSLIHRNAGKEEILEYLKSQNFSSLYQNGLLKASQGITSLEEVLRVSKNEI